MNKRFVKAKSILKALHDNGHEAYFVGGSVRDELLQKKIKDIDISTSARPDEVIGIFPKTIPVGIEHGTVIVIWEDEEYEVTTFRTDGTYLDHRRPSNVSFIKSLDEDLRRRDFTINAMAMDISGKVIDPFLGQSDLKDKLIRAVGNPIERFKEDALRMMRAVRFVSQLHFSIEQLTMNAIKVEAKHLAQVSIERIATELEKMLLGVAPNKGVTKFIESGLIDYVPCIKKENFEKKQFDKLISINETWAVICSHYDLTEVDECLKRWKRSNATINEVKNVIRMNNIVDKQGWSKELIYQFSLQCSLSTARVRCAITSEKEEEVINHIVLLHDQLPIKSRKEMNFSGHDVVQITQKRPGPWLGEVLNKIEQAIISGEVQNERSAIKEWLINWEQISGKNC
jgi:tRNA nucleotidyltransferase (CCA-adding enzyme)